MLSSIHAHEERRLVGVRKRLRNFDMYNTIIVLDFEDIVNTSYNLSLKSKSPKHRQLLSKVGFHVTLHCVKDGLLISSNLLRISKSTARHFNLMSSIKNESCCCKLQSDCSQELVHGRFFNSCRY